MSLGERLYEVQVLKHPEFQTPDDILLSSPKWTSVGYVRGTEKDIRRSYAEQGIGWVKLREIDVEEAERAGSYKLRGEKEVAA